MVKLVFLGRLADIAGGNEAVLDCNGPLDWPGLLDGMDARLCVEVTAEKVALAQNGRVITDKRQVIVQDGDELAFLPPVSGG